MLYRLKCAFVRELYKMCVVFFNYAYIFKYIKIYLPYWLLILFYLYFKILIVTGMECGNSRTEGLSSFGE